MEEGHWFSLDVFSTFFYSLLLSSFLSSYHPRLPLLAALRLATGHALLERRELVSSGAVGRHFLSKRRGGRGAKKGKEF